MLPGGLRRREQCRGEEERRAELAAPDNRGGIGQGGALGSPGGEVRRRRDRGGGGGPAAEAEEAGDTGSAAGERSERRHCGCSLQSAGGGTAACAGAVGEVESVGEAGAGWAG